jgi:hypothetical protein
MSLDLLLAVAITIPIALAAILWIASLSDRSAAAAPPRWKRVSAIAVMTAPSMFFAALVVWLAISWWSVEFAAPALAIMLMVGGLGLGPVFSGIEEARPTEAERIMRARHVVQGIIYVFSGVCWAVASFTHEWWFVFPGIASAWLGVIRLYMATGRELTA